MRAQEQTGVLGVNAQEEMLKRERRANNVWNKLKRNKTAMIGLVIVLFMIFIAVFAPFLTSVDPDAISPLNAYLLPGEDGHIFGTDEFGRDLFARILYGARVSMIVAVGGTVVAGIVGILLGLIAGYMGGFVDSVIMRIMDGLLAFPFCIAVHYPDDRSWIRDHECDHRDRYRKYSQLCQSGPWRSAHCKE